MKKIKFTVELMFGIGGMNGISNPIFYMSPSDEFNENKEGWMQFLTPSSNEEFNNNFSQTISRFLYNNISAWQYEEIIELLAFMRKINSRENPYEDWLKCAAHDVIIKKYMDERNDEMLSKSNIHDFIFEMIETDTLKMKGKIRCYADVASGKWKTEKEMRDERNF